MLRFRVKFFITIAILSSPLSLNLIPF